MVGPSTSEDDRSRSALRLKAGFVLLVGASAGIVAYRADATLAQAAVVVVAGLLLGLALVWFVARNLRQLRPDGTDRRLK